MINKDFNKKYLIVRGSRTVRIFKKIELDYKNFEYSIQKGPIELCFSLIFSQPDLELKLSRLYIFSVQKFHLPLKEPKPEGV